MVVVMVVMVMVAVVVANVFSSDDIVPIKKTRD